MGANNGVPIFFVYELNPQHVELDECRAAPLAGFENDYANGKVCEPLAFEFTK